MSEEASARSTAASQASQASTGGSSSADKGPAAADPTASGEAIDEMLAANDPPRKKQRQRVYPEPDFPIERLRTSRRERSYPIRFKLNAAALTRVLCEDGQPVGNSGASKVLKVDRARIVEWVRKEEQLRGCLLYTSPSPRDRG